MKRASLARRQRAQTIGLAAVVIVAMVGMLAFVVDLGFQQEARRELQNAATAAALAGIVKLPDDQAGAIADALTYAGQPANTSIPDRLCQPVTSPLPDSGATVLTGHPNIYALVTPGQESVGAGQIYTLTVTVECTSGYSFGRILNLSSTPIRASATAGLGSPQSASCPFPMGIWDSDGNAANGLQDSFGQTYTLGQPYPLFLQGDPLGSGNSGMIDVGSGAGAVSQAMAGGCDASTVPITADGTTFTETGVAQGPVIAGLTGPPMSRMQQCSGGGRPALCSTVFNNISVPGSPSGVTVTPDYACRQTFSDVINADGSVKDPNSVCLVVAPVVSAVISGHKQVTVSSFAMLFLAAYGAQGQEKILVAEFVKATLGGVDISAYVPGLSTSRLIR